MHEVLRRLPRTGWIVLLAAAAAGAAPACTFPEIGFGATSGGTAGTGGTGGTGGAPTAGGAGGTGGTGDTGGTMGVTSAGGAGGACTDGDGDGFPVTACGGVPADCDDTNKLVYPGEPAYYTMPNDKGFDWDCSGGVERDPASDKTVSCATFSACDPVPQGYIGNPPACGETGKWGHCAKNALDLCAPETLEPAKPMACK